jgi:hypothetical protein
MFLWQNLSSLTCDSTSPDRDPLGARAPHIGSTAIFRTREHACLNVLVLELAVHCIGLFSFQAAEAFHLTKSSLSGIYFHSRDLLFTRRHKHDSLYNQILNFSSFVVHSWLLQSAICTFFVFLRRWCPCFYIFSLMLPQIRWCVSFAAPPRKCLSITSP